MYFAKKILGSKDILYLECAILRVLSLGRRRRADFVQMRLGFQVVGEVRPADPLVAHRAVFLGVVLALVHVEVAEVV